MQCEEIKGAALFKERKRGFDKEQVESYIQRVAGEYRDMYAEYVSLLNKCNEFTETCLKLTNEKAASDETIAALRGNIRRLTGELESAKREEQRTEAPSEAISKALIDAETLAQEITDAARLEAARILEDASRETARIQCERDWAIVEIQNIRNKLTAFASASA
jgi:cell division septum initiation protein DivIVA